jgi:hypothetical protein
VIDCPNLVKQIATLPADRCTFPSIHMMRARSTHVAYEMRPRSALVSPSNQSNNSDVAVGKTGLTLNVCLLAVAWPQTIPPVRSCAALA